GAVSFTQYFGSALQLTPHLHVLVPEGLWGEEGFVSLPPPEPGEVEGILRWVVKQLAKDFAGLEVEWGEDGLEALQQAGIQQRLALVEEETSGPTHRKPRLAVVEGFRLHADTGVHAHDRQGLMRLCRYGSRGPVAEERLFRREDGRYEYRTKRGPTLVLTGAQLVKRLLALVPPKGKHLTCFHGVFAPHAGFRPQGPAPDTAAAPVPPPTAKPTRPVAPSTAVAQLPPRRPRLDWATLQRRTFGVDVWVCPCGGRRRVLTVVTSRSTAEEVLANMGLMERPTGPPAAQANRPPQLELAL
ncbi:MAG TPA: transposase, partial [bacterium]|nr:transposase [bacterium]